MLHACAARVYGARVRGRVRGVGPPDVEGVVVLLDASQAVLRVLEGLDLGLRTQGQSAEERPPPSMSPRLPCPRPGTHPPSQPTHGPCPPSQPTHATLPDESFLSSSMTALSSLIVSEVVCCLCSNCCEAGRGEAWARAPSTAGLRRGRQAAWPAGGATARGEGRTRGGTHLDLALDLVDREDLRTW